MDLCGHAGRIAATGHPAAEPGIGPRDHVGLYMANYVEFAIAKFAIARIGAVAVP